MVNQNRRKILTATGALALSLPAWAQLTIEMTGAGGNQIPVVLVPFAGDSFGISAVVAADLARAGFFKLVEASASAMTVESVVAAISRWSGASAVLAGTLTRQGDKYKAVCQLLDTVNGKQLAGATYTFSSNQSRLIAHRFADLVYEKLLGEPGVFSTRIAYILKHDNSLYTLNVADADGQNIQPWVRSPQPLLSPAWSPDGHKIAFVSMEKQKPILYLLDEISQRRMVLANYKGSNSAPAWSPDGKQLALVLTKDGNSQIYLIAADGTNLRRLTKSNLIDTEPTFSPDGQTIYFTSDRGGAPHIYRMGIEGDEPQRVTFEGNYNVSPKLSPDGRMLAYITRQNNKYQVCVMDLRTQDKWVVSDTVHDESPSFAPNGRMILYSTQQNGHDVLAVVSLNGQIRYKLITAGDVREPNWGPFYT